MELCGQKELAIRAGEILGKYPHVEDIYRDVKAIYEYTGKDYAVIVPSRIEEIMGEGEKLHHLCGAVSCGLICGCLFGLINHPFPYLLIIG